MYYSNESNNKTNLTFIVQLFILLGKFLHKKKKKWSGSKPKCIHFLQETKEDYWTSLENVARMTCHISVNQPQAF